MEDIPEMKRQGLVGRSQIWRTSVIVKQRSAERRKNSHFQNSKLFITHVSQRHTFKRGNPVCRISDSLSNSDAYFKPTHYSNAHVCIPWAFIFHLLHIFFTSNCSFFFFFYIFILNTVQLFFTLTLYFIFILTCVGPDFFFSLFMFMHQNNIISKISDSNGFVISMKQLNTFTIKCQILTLHFIWEKGLVKGWNLLKKWKKSSSRSPLWRNFDHTSR